MYIDSGNMILFKKAQNLEVVKTPDKFTDRELTRALRDAIIAEEGAIKQYETVVDATDNKNVKTVLQSIADEEKIHVGELQKLLKNILPDEQEKLDEGEKEVEDDLSKTASKIDPKEMAMGIEVEKEHADIYNVLKKMFGEDIPWTLEEFSSMIAKGHFKELPDYYSRLKKMEEEGKKENG